MLRNSNIILCVIFKFFIQLLNYFNTQNKEKAKKSDNISKNSPLPIEKVKNNINPDNLYFGKNIKR